MPAPGMTSTCPALMADGDARPFWADKRVHRYADSAAKSRIASRRAAPYGVRCLQGPAEVRGVVDDVVIGRCIEGRATWTPSSAAPQPAALIDTQPD
jgi:hypothetical protein